MTFRLGAALSMEYAVLELLSTLEHEVHRSELKELFSHHADRTYTQIENLEQAFGVLGTTPDGRPCLPIEAIDTQSKLDVSLVGDRFADTLILAGAAETAHHVIAMYESLITLVRSIGPQRSRPSCETTFNRSNTPLRKSSARSSGSPA